MLNEMAAKIKGFGQKCWCSPKSRYENPGSSIHSRTLVDVASTCSDKTSGNVIFSH